MRIYLAAAAIVVFGLPPTSALPAADFSYSARVGVIAGAYQGKGAIQLPQSDLRDEVNGSFEPTYGGTAGVALSSKKFDRWHFDAAIEALKVEFKDGEDQKSEANRTDLLFAGAYAVTDMLGLMAGYRLGWQGDGLFDDEVLSESGPFAGASVGGIKLCPRLGFAASAAYNFNRIDAAVERSPSQEFSYPGFGINASLQLLGTPHAIRARFQRFDGDTTYSRSNFDGPGQREEVLIEIEETYIQLFYTYTLGG